MSDMGKTIQHLDILLSKKVLSEKWESVIDKALELLKNENGTEKSKRLNPVYVMMPVKCIGKMCRNCEYLRIDTDVEISDDNENIQTEIDLICRNADMCLRLQQMMNERGNE